LLSPPDSQKSSCTPVLPHDGPTTPVRKVRIRRVKNSKKVYDEYTGHLGLSSPPPQEYDPHSKDDEWYMDEVEVRDVPSSVLRGVEGLWALAQ